MWEYWGVDSAAQFTESGFKRLPKRPDFWLRYLLTVSNVCTGISEGEMHNLWDEGIAVGLIDSALLQSDLTYNHSITQHLNRVYDALKSLAVTTKPAIYLDVEAGTQVHISIIEQWCEGARGIFVPGLYYNHYEPSHVAAADMILKYGGLLWDSEPQLFLWNHTLQSFSNVNPGQHVHLRQYSNGNLSGYVDYDACDSVAFDAMLHEPKPEVTTTPLEELDVLITNLSKWQQRYGSKLL